MKITLKSVEYSPSLSEETNAFSATVCIDGVPAFIASNHGTGGCDEHHPLKGQTYEAMRAKLDEVNAYGKTLPPDNSHPGITLEQDVESLVGDAFDAWLTEKEAARLYKRTKNRVVLIVGKEIRETTPVTAERAKGARDFMLKKYPGAIVLNDLTLEQALPRIVEAIAAA